MLFRIFYIEDGVSKTKDIDLNKVSSFERIFKATKSQVKELKYLSLDSIIYEIDFKAWGDACYKQTISAHFQPVSEQGLESIYKTSIYHEVCDAYYFVNNKKE